MDEFGGQNVRGRTTEIIGSVSSLLNSYLLADVSAGRVATSLASVGESGEDSLVVRCALVDFSGGASDVMSGVHAGACSDTGGISEILVLRGVIREPSASLSFISACEHN